LASRQTHRLQSQDGYSLGRHLPLFWPVMNPRRRQVQRCEYPVILMVKDAPKGDKVIRRVKEGAEPTLARIKGRSKSGPA
jgi:hypothetical protein